MGCFLKRHPKIIRFLRCYHEQIHLSCHSFWSKLYRICRWFELKGLHLRYLAVFTLIRPTSYTKMKLKGKFWSKQPRWQFKPLQITSKYDFRNFTTEPLLLFQPPLHLLFEWIPYKSYSNEHRTSVIWMNTIHVLFEWIPY